MRQALLLGAALAIGILIGVVLARITEPSPPIAHEPGTSIGYRDELRELSRRIDLLAEAVATMPTLPRAPRTDSPIELEKRVSSIEERLVEPAPSSIRRDRGGSTNPRETWAVKEAKRRLADLGE